jgi:hypothetical protein
MVRTAHASRAEIHGGCSVGSACLESPPRHDTDAPREGQGEGLSADEHRGRDQGGRIVDGRVEEGAGMAQAELAGKRLARRLSHSRRPCTGGPPPCPPPRRRRHRARSANGIRRSARGGGRGTISLAPRRRYCSRSPRKSCRVATSAGQHGGHRRAHSARQREQRRRWGQRVLLAGAPSQRWGTERPAVPDDVGDDEGAGQLGASTCASATTSRVAISSGEPYRLTTLCQRCIF